MWIKADVESPLFLSRLEKLARQPPHCFAEHQDRADPSAEISILTLVPNEPDIPKGFHIILFPDRQIQYRVVVDAEARGWVEAYPDYEEYTALTRRFIRPLLKVYNKRYRSNRRLHVQTKEQLRPKLSHYPAQLFHHFVDNANKSFLSQKSWRDFYKLIICCHRRNEYLTWDDVEFLLKEAGFGDYYCERLYTIFEHGWGILEELPESKLRAWRRQMREQERRERQNRHRDSAANSM